MVVLRTTRKLRGLLPITGDQGASSDGALGDWYVNRFVVDRRPLLIVMSELSLFSVITPAREVRSLPQRLASIVAGRLRGIGIDERLVEAEAAAMTPVIIGGTKDRSVLGSLIEFCRLAELSLPINGWDETSLPEIETFLQGTPCRCGGRFEDTIFPADKTRRLLEERWPADAGRVAVAARLTSVP